MPVPPDVTDVARAAEAVFDLAREQAACRRFLVALSGGLDSTVLVHLAAGYGARHGLDVFALHVDHGLQAGSADWIRHCRETAARLEIGFEAVTLSGRAERGQSIEQWARAARYRELSARASRHTCVMTAHHLDDQVETVLHHALRGAGPHGLGGIRPLREFGPAHLARPLLTCRRRELRDYAHAHGLRWVDDPSNADERFTRNLIRARVLPALEDAFPDAVRSLGRLAAMQGELADLLDHLADAVLDAEARTPWRLACASLRRVDARMQPYVLKRWLARAGHPVPGRRHLAGILGDVVDARLDAMPRVQWGGSEVRRYDDCLFVFRSPAGEGPAASLPWDPREPLNTPHGRLALAPSARPALSRSALHAAPAEVRWRTGGERCRPAGRAGSRLLKKLFQDWRIPPWERERTPLVVVGDRLAAVGDRCICEGFQASTDDDAVKIVWAPKLYAAPPSAAA